jgi:alpha-glucosidase (family GH31 glycosyl hydrolase)
MKKILTKLLCISMYLFGLIESTKRFTPLKYLSDGPTTYEYSEMFKLDTGFPQKLDKQWKFNLTLQDSGLKDFHNSDLNIQFNLIKKNILQIKINGKEPKYELPEEEPFPYHKNFDTTKFDDGDFIVEYSTTNPFSFTVKRKSTGVVLFSTENMNIIIGSDASYAEVSTKVPSEYIFGVGERTSTQKLQNGTYTIWNRDTFAHYDTTYQGGNPKYGSHPIYLAMEADGNFHIMYLRNSYPMDFVFNSPMATWKIAGGVLDFTIFLGQDGKNDPESVIKEYHTYLGGYAVPPFWAMGFHQCRWGYKSNQDLLNVLQGYERTNIPMDTIWMDIDYMVDKQPITVDETRYDPQQLHQMLQQYDKKFVMIAEPSVSLNDPQAPFLLLGYKNDLFIKNSSAQNLTNYVWPGPMHFIDYFHPNVADYWNQSLDYLHDKLSFSGVWLDMNEIATFKDGQVDGTGESMDCHDSVRYPYRPKDTFENKTLCPNAQLGQGKHQYVNIHNYYALKQGELTYNYLTNKFNDTLPFILTRSNSAGSGKYVAHWSGDNNSTYEFMQFSIGEVSNMNLFGIPMAGADICGFDGNPTEVLCAQFYQMGSLYPFSRSHNKNDTEAKEPYAMGKVLEETVRQSLRYRYSILKYYYSLFMKSNGIGTIFKPLFYAFPGEIELASPEVMETQFMIGDDLLVTPNFNRDPNVTKRTAYFPKANWYNLRDHTMIPKSGANTVDVPLNDMPTVFLRGGKTIFRNTPDLVKNTRDLDDILYLDIAVDDQGISKGLIPSISNYHSKNSVQTCIAKACGIAVLTSFQDKTLNISFPKSTFYDNEYDYLSIAGFRLYGLTLEKTAAIDQDMSNLKDIVQKDHDGDWCTLTIENERSAYIDINGIIKLKKDDSVNAIIVFK